MIMQMAQGCESRTSPLPLLLARNIIHIINLLAVLLVAHHHKALVNNWQELIRALTMSALSLPSHIEL